MRNAEIAKVLSTLSDLLELKAENVFKVRSWRQALDIVNTAPRDGFREFLAGQRRRVAEGVR